MIDLTGLLFGNHREMTIFFIGMFLYVFALCLPSYINEKDPEKRKDTLVQWVVLGLLFIVGAGISAFFWVYGR